MQHVPCRFLLGSLLIDRNFPGLLTTLKQNNSNKRLRQKCPARDRAFHFYQLEPRLTDDVFITQRILLPNYLTRFRDANRYPLRLETRWFSRVRCTSQCPCRRRCTAWRGPSWRR